MFKPGQTWENRKGESLGILDVTDDLEYPVIAMTKKKVLLRFTRDGRFINEFTKHEKDLIKLL